VSRSTAGTYDANRSSEVLDIRRENDNILRTFASGGEQAVVVARDVDGIVVVGCHDSLGAPFTVRMVTLLVTVSRLPMARGEM
jgi:hypothetical protein